MKIIAFSGVDGSGKSTQRELLQNYLEGQGAVVSYFHATEFSLANRLRRKMANKKDFSPGQERAVIKANFFSTLLRIFFLTLDGIRFQSYERCLEKSGITVLISDRFFQDSLINIAFLSRNIFIRACIRLLANALPIPEQSFYLKLSLKDIVSRSRIPEQGIEYLEEKIKLYDHPPFSWSPYTLDATRSPGTIHQSVIGKLGSI